MFTALSATSLTVSLKTAATAVDIRKILHIQLQLAIAYLDIQITDLIPRIELSRDCLAAVHKSLGFSLLSVYCPQITSR